VRRRNTGVVLQIVERIVQCVDFELAAVTGTAIHFADCKAAREQTACRAAQADHDQEEAGERVATDTAADLRRPDRQRCVQYPSRDGGGPDDQHHQGDKERTAVDDGSAEAGLRDEDGDQGEHEPSEDAGQRRDRSFSRAALRWRRRCPPDQAHAAAAAAAGRAFADQRNAGLL
jgi:hypothetical protein